MKLLVGVLLLCVAVTLTHSKPRAARATCGYDSCHPLEEGVTNVHIVPHTHDDVGWLKTVDQYFYGSNTRNQKAGVQYILDSVVDSLLKNPERKFVYIETAFFWRWWIEQSEERRDEVKFLVSEGRLEFSGGAWSMNDEAATHYQSIIDQFTWGLRKLNDTFGECGRPKAGWQIDPFGHSREMANIFAGLGFDAVLLGRIDFQDKSRRLATKEPEMLWRGNDDLGAPSDLFTGLLYNRYSPPPGFCYDLLCDDDPIIDDVNSPDNNVDSSVDRLVEYIDNMVKAYKSNNVLITMGDDFMYQDANMWFKNLDKLIKYVNEKVPRVRLFYSTPSCYVKSVNDAGITFPSKEDDFFPYGSDAHSYWTGYFSSRPTLKYFERAANNLLQVCKQLLTLTNISEEENTGLDMLRSAMGVMQHHDAITGTEKQHVARDYARLLNIGVQDCLASSREALNELISGLPVKSNKPKAAPLLQANLCQLNITQCATSENSRNFVVTLYNPLGQAVNHYARIPVSGDNYIVKDPAGNTVASEVMAMDRDMFSQLTERVSNATGELVFLAASLPPLGYRSYYISTSAAASPKPVADDDDSIENENIKVTVEPTSGLVSSIFLKEYDLEVPMTQEFLYYEGERLNNGESKNRSSGAYVFRPKSANVFPISDKVTYAFVKGELVEEIHQKFADWATQVVRLYKGSNHVEFEWLIGSIPVDNDVGKEVISKFSANMKTQGIFYTDSNGRQLLKRVIDYRPTWNLSLEESASGNYYPVTSSISIREEESDLELSVLTDRAQGGSSLRQGDVELMIHRRLLNDDAFGVGEALNEKEGDSDKGLVTKGRHFLLVGKTSDKVSVARRQLVLEKQLEPTTFISSADTFTIEQWQEGRNEFSGLKRALPANVHLFTVEPWKSGTMIVRLEHFFEGSDDPQGLSRPAEVDLEDLFSGIEVLSATETTLGGNQLASDSSRLVWRPDTVEINAKVKKSSSFSENSVKALVVTLNPMEIKTFIVAGKFLG